MVEHGVVVLLPTGKSLLDRLAGSAISFCNWGGASSLLWGAAHALDGLEGWTEVVFLQSFVGEVVVKLLEVALSLSFKDTLQSASFVSVTTETRFTLLVKYVQSTWSQPGTSLGSAIADGF